MKFSIIIPAYNEEQSIESIIRRCLAAKEAIIQKTPVDDVEIIVVSDGSADGTVAIAQQFVPEIVLIAYAHNQGYGIAIKTGFENAEGEIVSFLDADGTCDPLYFIDMITKLLEENADICIGSRMGKNSQMPRIRRIGNIFYKNIINLIAGTEITDAASGMRVIRADSLKNLYPLPDGLSFTPGMTCRAVLDPDLKIVEIVMSYREREGRSKLNVISDGFNFLKVIISIALTYKPLKILGFFGFFLILLSFVFCIAPSIAYLRNGFVSNESLLSLFPVMLFGTTGMILLGLASVAERAILLFNKPQKTRSIVGNSIRWFFSWEKLWFVSPLLLLTGIFVGADILFAWILGGGMSPHPLRMFTSYYLVLLGIVCFAFGVTDYLLVLSYQKKCHGENLEKIRK